MKVVQINQVCYGSTGKISIGISKLLTEHGIENYIYYTYGNCDYPLAVKYASNLQTKVYSIISRLGGKYGFYYRNITRKLIRELDRIKPDIVHLHNIHGHNVNLSFLFSYLRQKNIKVVWTFHDCWALTGYCTHFDLIKCEKWKTECNDCVQSRKYSWLFDKSEWIHRQKKELLKNFNNLTIVTPSKWLANLVKESFLKDAAIEIIPNGIDLRIFSPTQSDFRKYYNLTDKRIILGVAMSFDENKGFSHFLKLSRMLDDSFRIVLVGVSNEQMKELPDNIIGIEKTANQKELAQIYSAADIFVNCTLEDTFPTVNLEALACGTPIITFKTGGSPEAVYSNTGIVVEQGNISALLDAILQISSKDLSKECLDIAKTFYDEKKCFLNYIQLYNRI